MGSNYLRGVLAASAAVCAVAAATPAAAQTKTFDVPAQSAATGIPELARQADIQILVSESAVQGQRTRAVKGRMAVEQALRRLLAGTGLKILSSDGRTYTLAREAAGILQSDPPTGLSSARNAGSIVAGEEQASSQEIVVTGTRIRGAEVASPVLTISRQEMRLAGQNNLGDLIRSLPQNFNGGQNPGLTVVSSGATAGGAANQNITGSSSLNLRGLGPDATLTLLNGSRLPYDGFMQATDISSIPAAAIERIDILLDGASAIYGSDAVGGVANVILRRDIDGVELSARHGWATEGGYGQWQLTGVAGTVWNSGGLILTGDYSTNNAVRAKDRSFLKTYPNQSVTIFPDSKQMNVLFSGHQRISPSIELAFDGFYSDRRQKSLSVGSTFTSNIDSDSFGWGVAPSVRVDLPAGWMVAVRGFAGGTESTFFRTFTSSTTGGSLGSSRPRYSNDTLAAGVEAEGPIATFFGKDVRMSAGGGYRENKFENFNLLTGRAVVGGSDKSYYAYGEVNFPLVAPGANIPFVRKIDLDAAVRYEHHNTFGSVTTPRISALWEVVSGFDVKASWGTSFKVPQLTQQFESFNVELYSATVFGGPADKSVLYAFGRRPNLQPERADVFTAGIVLSPPSISGFRAEIGYYRINYDNRVVNPVVPLTQALTNPIFQQFVVPSPAASQQSAFLGGADQFSNFSGTAYIPANVIAIVDSRYANAASQKASGFDAQLRYSLPAFGGRMTSTANLNWVKSHQTLTPLAPVQQTSARIFYPAEFRARGGVSWFGKGLSVAAFLNHTSGVVDTNANPNVRRQSMQTVDFAASYRIESGKLAGLEVSISGTNVFDESPPPITPQLPYVFNYDSTNYSALGRVVSVTLTSRF